MKSPFPGMDPFLERFWQDVHSTFMVYAKQQLNRQLPSDLLARVESSLSVENDLGLRRVVYPDASISEYKKDSIEFLREPGAVAVADTFEISIPTESPPQRHLEIFDSGSGNKVITVLELLSPANKVQPAGREAYWKKQHEYIRGRVNLEEIDLLRCGEFVLAVPEDQWPAKHNAPYKICIRRVQSPWTAGGIAIQLNERLPNIAIPLRPTDRDVVLELQPILDDCYRDGRYHTIDYSQPLNPPLTSAETQWLSDLLANRS